MKINPSDPAYPVRTEDLKGIKDIYPGMPVRLVIAKDILCALISMEAYWSNQSCADAIAESFAVADEFLKFYNQTTEQ